MSRPFHLPYQNDAEEEQQREEFFNPHRRRQRRQPRYVEEMKGVEDEDLNQYTSCINPAHLSRLNSSCLTPRLALLPRHTLALTSWKMNLLCTTQRYMFVAVGARICAFLLSTNGRPITCQMTKQQDSPLRTWQREDFVVLEEHKDQLEHNTDGTETSTSSTSDSSSSIPAPTAATPTTARRSPVGPRITYPKESEIDEDSYFWLEIPSSSDAAEHASSSEITTLRILPSPCGAILAATTMTGQLVLFDTQNLSAPPIVEQLRRHEWDDQSAWSICATPCHSFSSLMRIFVGTNAHYAYSITIGALENPSPSTASAASHPYIAAGHNIPCVETSPCGKFLALTSIDQHLRIVRLTTSPSAAQPMCAGQIIVEEEIAQEWGWTVRWIDRRSVMKLPYSVEQMTAHRRHFPEDAEPSHLLPRRESASQRYAELIDHMVESLMGHAVGMRATGAPTDAEPEDEDEIRERIREHIMQVHATQQALQQQPHEHEDDNDAEQDEDLEEDLDEIDPDLDEEHPEFDADDQDDDDMLDAQDLDHDDFGNDADDPEDDDTLDHERDEDAMSDMTNDYGEEKAQEEAHQRLLSQQTASSSSPFLSQPSTSATSASPFPTRAVATSSTSAHSPSPFASPPLARRLGTHRVRLGLKTAYSGVTKKRVRPPPGEEEPTDYLLLYTTKTNVYLLDSKLNILHSITNVCRATLTFHTELDRLIYLEYLPSLSRFLIASNASDRVLVYRLVYYEPSDEWRMEVESAFPEQTCGKYLKGMSVQEVPHAPHECDGSTQISLQQWIEMQASTPKQRTSASDLSLQPYTPLPPLPRAKQPIRYRVHLLYADETIATYELDELGVFRPANESS